MLGIKGSVTWQHRMKDCTAEHLQTVPPLWCNIKYQFAIGANFVFIQGNSFSTQCSTQFWCIPGQTTTNGLKERERKEHINHILFKIIQEGVKVRHCLGRCTSVIFFLCLNHSLSTCHLSFLMPSRLTCVCVHMYDSNSWCDDLLTKELGLPVLWVATGEAAPLGPLLKTFLHTCTPQNPDLPKCLSLHGTTATGFKMHSHLQIHSSTTILSLSSKVIKQEGWGKVFPKKGKKNNPFFAYHVQATITKFLYQQHVRDLHWETCQKARWFWWGRGFFIFLFFFIF